MARYPSKLFEEPQAIAVTDCAARGKDAQRLHKDFQHFRPAADVAALRQEQIAEQNCRLFEVLKLICPGDVPNTVELFKKLFDPTWLQRSG